MKNRRNFYRILHVQPEAPVEIIKASYRSLMTKLNAHPDRGGDHETAALINQAYAVLGDTHKRKKYDDMLLLRNRQAKKDKAATSSSYEKNWASEGSRFNQDSSNPAGTSGQWSRFRCMFCKTEIFQDQTRICTQCESPLMPAQPIQKNRVCE